MKINIKRLFLVWFGDTIPDYVYWNIENHKKINDDFNVFFIHYTTKQLLNYKDQNDSFLIESIKEYIKRSKNNNYYKEFKLNAIVDIYKTKILTNEYDTYVDCDTFPISKISDFISTNEKFEYFKPLFQIKRFAYWNYHKTEDNWLISKCNVMPYIIEISKNISFKKQTLYHNGFYINDDEKDFLKNRFNDFYNCKLKIGDNFCYEKLSPIEHYYTCHYVKNSKNYINQKIDLKL